MTEKKVASSSLKNQDWKKISLETEKVTKVFKNILTDKINEINNLFTQE